MNTIILNVSKEQPKNPQKLPKDDGKKTKKNQK